MRYCKIGDPPVYTEEIERCDRETDADGEAMGGVIEQLLNNDHHAREAINRLLGEPVYVTFLAAEWIGDAAPYEQTVAVDGVTAEDNPMLVSALKNNATVEEHRAYNKAFGIIAAGIGITADGSVTYKVYKKPATDVMVGLRGV